MLVMIPTSLATVMIRWKPDTSWANQSPSLGFWNTKGEKVIFRSIQASKFEIWI